MSGKLYDRHEFSMELFQNPTSEYRGAPFWAWNTKPTEEMLDFQMKALADMGFGGFHIHSRTGLDVPYLSDEFMSMVKHCVEYADAHKLLAWGYDEDRFPSGFAGGLVTKEKRYRYRELFWTPNLVTGYQAQRPNGRAEESFLIGAFRIVLDEDGKLEKSELLSAAEYEALREAACRAETAGEDEEILRSLAEQKRQIAGEGAIWFAYCRLAVEDSWFNNQTYVDTLDKASIERFCEVTHERYRQVVGEYFGTTIPSFFTDEPKVTYKKTFGHASDCRNLIMPWTDNFPDTFLEKYGMDLIPKIPELFWELPGQEVSQARYYYHRHVAERFTESYSQTIGDWCRAHGVSLTGHMIKEPSLKSQSTAVGESMAPLGPFGLPGIDMLCDEREYTTAKQAQSIAHQFGREGVLSELYGVTNWDFDFRGHKLGGDWQAALGVTVRVPHLSWMTMEGEAKRDYPASIHYQSPWYREYQLIETHFARVNTVMTRGTAIVRIGVIHPVESYWCYWGPEEHTADIRQQLNDQFSQLTEWLLFAHQDFDFISESVLAEKHGVDGQCLRVGESAYDVVLVPNVATLRQTTIEALEAFQKAGGHIVFAGVPSMCEARRMTGFEQRFADSAFISFDKQSVLRALEPYREVRLTDKNGNVCNKHLYQLRRDGDNEWMYLVYGKKKPRYDCEGLSKMWISKKGIWHPIRFNTMTGECEPCIYRHEKNQTIVEYEYCVHDSLLIQFRKEKPAQDVEAEEKAGTANCASARVCTDLDRTPVVLEEPNVSVLDLAEFSLDGGEFRPREEVLRIGQLLRGELELPLQSGRIAQPWVTGHKAPEHTVTLRYQIESECAVSGVKLALEQADRARILLNDASVPVRVDGWYVDTKILTVPLPDLRAGMNELVITLPFGEGSNLENAFLLGDFGVRVCGSSQVLTKPVRTLAFGDITVQGLPFYGGNLTYQIDVDLPDGAFAVRTSYYRGALIGVSVDGKREGTIAFSPYRFEMQGLEPGQHTIGLTLFGNRVNTFGCLHNCNENTTWFGPDAWRTRGDSFSYEYQLKKTGILKRPEFE